MAGTRSRREELEYKAYQRSVEPGICVFCVIQKGSDQLIEEYRYFKVIKNIYSYSMWDGQGVVDHIMVTPKKHTDSLAGMTPAQKLEYVDIITDYEGRGYNVYARTPGSRIKSVVHQHTHLIKADGRSKKFLLFMNKPYVRWMF